MQRFTWSPRSSGKRVLPACIALLLLVSSVATPAVAAPRLFVSGGSIDSGTAIAGEDVNVTVRVTNTGSDGGALTVAIKRNNTKVAEHRVIVESDSSNQFTETIQFDDPGRYVIKADDRKIGTIRVQRAAAAVANQTGSQRTVAVRAGSVPTDEPYTLDFPDAANRSFAVETWTVQTGASSYEQQIVEYTDPTAATVDVPSGRSATVASVFTVDSTVGVERATVRFSLNRSRLRAVGLEQREVTVYHRNGSAWEPLETALVEERVGSVVYEATATDFSTFAVGRIDPEFAVEDTSLGTTQVEGGQRLVLEAVVRNNGSVTGDYEGAMVLDGERVNETTVSIPAESERTVRLSHDVRDAGTYEIALNDEDAGSIVITEGQVADDTPATDTGPTDSQSTADDTPATGDGPDIALPAGVPATVLGIDTVYLAGGIGVALVVFFGLVLVLRRRGGGNDSGGFDQL